MTQFNLSGLKKILNPSSGKRNVVDQITDRLSKSSIGLSSGDDTLNAVSFSGMDAFDLTQNISELLSPACGMTEEEKQAELARIQAKLKSGKKLTEEEMRFLQAVDPQLYMQAARIQAMRDSLEQQLEHCKSKEEAASIFGHHVDGKRQRSHERIHCRRLSGCLQRISKKREIPASPAKIIR